ncbi:flagella basal body P-ring formation protein FlgA [Bacillus sp. FJAT-49736]|uniref:flagella basal body P-ring formation protein FlgA n=1 Tax=Bacillus sp. FJAT-49736 TaxID=2833582 RepID=UPI001BCA4965|nr:flagella basal body P-ring formation protein FlgA [Bacillus sp. FJAT-49736]MBS4175844.1 flagella basal body P-ring formation protein FlgA [Bacillus sp. FJAT-49736]
MLESKRRAMIFLILSLLLAAIAGFLVLKKVQDINANLGTLVKVYVANTNIPSRTLIKPSDVRTDEIPKKYLRDYHITNTEDLVNKVSVVPLSAGDIITKNILKQATAVLNENDRLLTLMQSDKVYFDEPLEAQDRVDIVVSDQFSGKKQTYIFMSDVKVVRVAKEKNSFKGVQLEIPITQVPKLIHYQNYADSIRIVKANVGKEHNSTEAAASEVVNSPIDSNQDEKSNVKENEQKESNKVSKIEKDKGNSKKDSNR